MRRAIASGTVLLLAAAFLVAPACAQRMPEALEARLRQVSPWGDGSVLRFTEADREALAALEPLLEHARRDVEAFFGASFPDPLRVTVLPDRESFSAALRSEWGVPETACWMVATGVADFMVILSPRRWQEEACEHDPSDRQHLQDILTHEATHVFHGQHNSTRDFSGAEEVGWFAEGLAVLVAGQLDRDRLSDPREAVASGAAPARLSEAWSGKYRYGVSGSLVRFIDRTYGRETLTRLLGATSQAALLTELRITEIELLESWRRWVTAPDG